MSAVRSMIERAWPASISRSVIRAENTMASTWPERSAGRERSAQRNFLEFHAGLVGDPQGGDVRRRRLGADADFLARQILDGLDGRVRLDDQVPAHMAGAHRGDHLLLHALAHRERHRRAEIRDDVGRARPHGLLGGGAAAKHDQLDVEVVLLEQPEPLRREGGRIVEAFGRKPDADRVGLRRAGAGGDQCRDGERLA